MDRLHWWKRLPALPMALFALLAAVVVVLPIHSASANVAPILTRFFTVTDQQGANDVPAQSDLTQVGRDDRSSTYYDIFWSWDSTDQWTGSGQTGDACALFDKNGDGKAHYAVCAQIHNVSLTDVELTGVMGVWQCDAAWTDRCGQPSAVPTKPAQANFGVLQQNMPASPDRLSNGDLVTPTDPFAAGSNYPNDSTVEGMFSRSLFSASESLINVCSYPSAGNGGNNNPFDCIVNPGGTPGISLTKTPTPTTFSKVGDVVNYTLTATNSGQVSLSGVTITDAEANVTFSPACPTVNLLPGEKLTCTASYTITQQDLDTGSFVNHASTSGTGSGKTVSATATATVYGTQSAQLSLSKTPKPTTYSAAGDPIGYTLVATNTGNVTLTDVSISDAALGTLTCTQGVTLAPGATLTCTGTREVTQTDVDNGSYTNNATAAGNFGASPVTANASATVFSTAAGQLSLTKVAGSSSYDAPNQKIDYTLTAKNTGTITLTGVTITDSRLSNLSCTPAQPAALAPGASLVCTGSYTTIQADVDANSVDNTAGVTGFDGTHTITATASASVPAVHSPALSLKKTASPTTYDSVGAMIGYTLVATNTGNVTLTDVSISDTGLGTLTCTQPVTLAPGATLTCSGSHVATQADLDAGSYVNNATAGGTFDGNTVPATAQATVTAIQSPALALTKNASPTTYSGAGQSIKYTYVVKNTGNVTLAGPVTVSDDHIGTPAGTSFTCGTGALAPGDTTTCTATYTTTSADVASGSVTNAATASASGTTSPVAHATVTYTAPPVTPAGSPLLTLSKSSVPASGSIVVRGDLVTYTLDYANTGTADASGVVVSDALPADMTVTNPGTGSVTGNAISWTVGTLAAGASGTVTFTATVADTATNGEVLDNVGTLAAGGTTLASNPDELTVSVPTPGNMTLVKAVDKTAQGENAPLRYTLVVTAPTDASRDGVTVTDSIPTGTTYTQGSCAGAPCSIDGGVVTWQVGSLAAGSSATLSFAVTINTVPEVNGVKPPETITNVALANAPDDPGIQSNKVQTSVTEVLGEKVTRPAAKPPAAKPPVTQVLGEKQTLPFTGAPVGQMLWRALALLLAGAMLLLVGRRRRARS